MEGSVRLHPMNDLLDFAHELARTAGKITGHQQNDWLILAQTSGTTMRWGAQMAQAFTASLAGNSATQDLLGSNRELRETNLATWLEGVLSGAPSRAFWAECSLVGLAHASASVPSGLVVAGARQLEGMFLERCIAAFEPVEAMRVHAAFARVLATALAVMTTSAEEATRDCLAEMGVDKSRFHGRMKFSIQHRVREERARLPAMDWGPALSVGIESIDVQHRQLFAMLNEYHRASTSEGDEALLRQTVGDLIDYTKIHFAFEETLLERNAYDGLEAHKDGHMRLAKQVHHFADAANFGAGLYAAELYFFLRTWLNGHIRGSDRRYGPHLLERGVR
jgi:hemerythrin